MALPHCQATAQQERGRMAAAPKRAQDAKATGRTESHRVAQLVKNMASRLLRGKNTVCEEMCGNVQNDVTSLLFR